MTVETIHDEFAWSHLMRFYDASIVTSKVFRHKTVLGAEITVLKQLTKRLRLRVTPEARALLVEDARHWALDGPKGRDLIGADVLAYLTGTAPYPGEWAARRLPV